MVGSFGLPIRLVDLLSPTSVDGTLEFSAPYGAVVWAGGSVSSQQAEPRKKVQEKKWLEPLVTG